MVRSREQSAYPSVVCRGRRQCLQKTPGRHPRAGSRAAGTGRSPLAGRRTGTRPGARLPAAGKAARAARPPPDRAAWLVDSGMDRSAAAPQEARDEVDRQAARGRRANGGGRSGRRARDESPQQERRFFRRGVRGGGPGRQARRRRRHPADGAAGETSFGNRSRGLLFCRQAGPALVVACNLAKHLEAPRWRTPFQAIRGACTKGPARFGADPRRLAPAFEQLLPARASPLSPLAVAVPRTVAAPSVR